MSGHTPGPWTEDGQTGSIWEGVSPVNRQTGLRIAVVDISSLSETEDRANARLIAAAPDLLGALELLHPKNGCTCKDLDTQAVVHTALKKARGE